MKFLASCASYHSGGTSSPPHEVEHASTPPVERTLQVVGERAQGGVSLAPHGAGAATSSDADLVHKVSIPRLVLS